MLLQRQLSDLADITEDHLDLTPMVDVVFQLMTFLLLTYQASAESPVEIPKARYGIGVEETDSIILTLEKPSAPGGPAIVYDGPAIDPERRLADADAIRQAVERGLVQGKRRVVIEADGAVPHGEVLRVAGAAAEVQGVTLHVGVEEPD